MRPPKLLEMIHALIATPSVSSVSPEYDTGNREVIELLAGWLEAMGFAVETMPIEGQDGKANLVATLGSGPGGLVLSGHTDTVPCDPGLWRHDPFAATQADERIYGLGSADMKSFFALAIEAARDLDPRRLREPLIICATADEESGMSGAEALVAAGRPRGRYAVVGEPTGLRPVRMHKGYMMAAIRLEGRSGHSSDPALGNNALDGMYRVLGELIDWRRSLAGRYSEPAFAVPAPTLNLGHVHGGDNPNRICGSCELHFDLRPLPGMSREALYRELDERLAAIPSETGLRLTVTPLMNGSDPLATPPESPIVRAAEALAGAAAGAVAFGTEGPYLSELGMETVVLGPGHIEQAHQPDEFVETAKLAPTIDLLRALIGRFCAGDG